MNTETCKLKVCSAELVFVRTEKGRQMPVDLETAKCAAEHAACAHPYFEHQDGGGPCGRDGCGCMGFVMKEEFDASYHVAHWGTCKDAARFKRKRR